MIDDADYLKSQLAIARTEIKNLRQQVLALNHSHRKDVDHIRGLLADFRCPDCTEKSENESKSENEPATNRSSTLFRPIGVIRTAFPEKRAVPRQSTVATQLQGRLEINSDVFNNPEHSLEGLDTFSHLWIIYHFHKNNSHPKAKVTPPRLGERVGVFSTRSPHRPCPIGLSLVQIDRIEQSHIYFMGTDMVDGTPVLDIKPYIPQYDNPTHDSESEARRFSIVDSENEFYCTREAPDGQETSFDASIASTSGSTPNGRSSTIVIRPSVVKVPNWIMAGPTLNVVFNDRALTQIKEYGIEQKSVSDVLESDPRSVYLRTKHNSQIFTFQLGEVTVTCKFDDQQSSVTVVQVRKTQDLNNREYST